MTEVTCPRCHTSQQIEGDGYLCAGCATEWAFVRCSNCGSAFHMQPGVGAWTCPSCGTANGSGGGRRVPAPVVIAIAALVVVAVAAFLVFSGGEDGEPNGGGDGNGTEDALTTTCAHIQGGFQVLRQQALTQTATQLDADAEALRAEGDEATAALVDDLVVATQDLVAVLGSGEDTTEANQALGEAISAVPCGGG